jgi:hypothetical protein
MHQFKINEQDYQIATNWDELTLGQLLEFEDCVKNQSSFEIQEEFMCRVFEILCDVEPGGLDEMDLDELGNLTEAIKPLLTPRQPSDPKEFILINDIQYILDRNQSGKRNMREMKIIGLIKARSTKEIEIIPRMLAVLVRPGKIEFHPETGEKVYTLEKLNMDDIEGRAELFMKKVKATDVIDYLTFFLNGINKS